jgi:diadenosine tetraphosphatase ApaH/serine/threonine PP2A family protein phosphatase
VLLGFLSDPHANLQALEAVLADVDRVKPDSLICLGDFVGYGANPNEVVEALRDRCDVNLIGNHDLAALAAIDISDFNPHAAAAATWTQEQLSAGTREFLESLSPTGKVGDIELAHASIRDPIWEYVLDSSIATASFDEHPFQIAFVGHTHVPAVFSRESESRRVSGFRIIVPAGSLMVREIPRLLDEGARVLINPGGIGQPRDGDPRASWATWAEDEQVLTLRRVEYPVSEAQRVIVAAGLPELLAERLAEGW